MLKNVSRPTHIVLRRSPFSAFIARRHASGKRDEALAHTAIRQRILTQTPELRTLANTKKATFNDLVARSQFALKQNNLRSALHCWEKVSAFLNDTLSAEGARALHPVENKIAAVLLQTLDGPKAGSDWTPEIYQNVQTFALSVARNGQAGTLNALLLHYIQRGETDIVLSLYDKFFHSLGDTLAGPSKSAASEILDEVESADAFDPHRTSVLCTVIAALALKNDFKAAFDAYYASGIRIRHYRRTQTLEQLSSDPDFAARLRTYFSRLEICYLVLRPPSFVKQIHNLATSNALNQLRRLFDNVLDGIQGSSPYIAPSPATLDDSRLVAVPETAWSAFQVGFLMAGHPQLAKEVWLQLEKMGVSPGVTMWTGLLDYYADQRNSAQALKVWTQMHAEKVLPDELSYRAIIACLFDDRQPARATQLFEEFRSKFPDISERGVAVFNSFIQGLLRANQYQEARNMVTDMKENGPPPDIITFNTFIAYHARLNDFKGLASVVAEMQEAGVKGDVVTFSTILSALLHVGRRDAVGTLLAIMAKQGVKPNIATYTAMIDSQMRDDTEAGLQAALDLLQRLEQDPAIKPNEITYTAVLAGLHRSTWMSREQAEAVRKDVLDRMRRMKIPFTLRAFHILIRGAFDSPEPNGYKDALAWLLQMEKDGVPRVRTTWYLVLSGLIKKEQWDVARELVRKMSASGVDTQSPALSKLVNQIHEHW